MRPRAARSGSYSTADVARITGLSYRQIDYLDRQRVVQPTVGRASGSGSFRLYSGDELESLILVAKLLEAGVSATVICRDRNPYRTAARVVRAVEHLIPVEVPA